MFPFQLLVPCGMNDDNNQKHISTQSDVESVEEMGSPFQLEQQPLSLPVPTHRDEVFPTSDEIEKKRNCCRKQRKSKRKQRTYTVNDAKSLAQSRILAVFIMLLGIAASGAFLGLGVSTLRDTEKSSFERFSYDLYHKVDAVMVDYAFAASMTHARCRSRNFTRQDFRDLYEYVVGDGLDVQAVEFKPRVLKDERATFENEAREYYAIHYPLLNYTGFTGFNHDNSTKLEPRDEADVYYPVQYHEPVFGNERAAGLDFYASGSRRRAIDESLRTGKPAISDRLLLVQETVDQAYGVVLLHPGQRLSSQLDIWPRDLASLVIRIPDLLKRSTMFQEVATDVYLFDQSQNATFLGGIRVTPRDMGAQSTENVTLLPEINVMELPSNAWKKDILVSNKVWCLAILPSDGTFNPAATVFVIVGAIAIFVGSVFLAISVHAKTHQIIQYNSMKQGAEQEKAKLIIDTANKLAKSERELNDFIAHEVRNPVASAMAACSFVERTTVKNHSALDDESWDGLRADVKVISNALYFVNDLLRTMLDMHRATSQQLVVKLDSVHAFHDVLEPVQSILYSRGNIVRLYVECDTKLYALADKLRLKQVILNLGRNSTKFVESGFIRFTAKKVPDDDTIIEFAVEDSGPGIPIEKRRKMFTKYQDSLDGLAQGTGIGLYLCKKLVTLMGGTLTLDESYDSGIPGCPGTRITFCLKASMSVPTQPDDIQNYQGGDAQSSLLAEELEIPPALPEGLSVLFVDDDAILRKLFARVTQRVAPSWEIRHASNGETALQLTDTETFDLIFMDMYMASVEKQLLGTEAVVALRAKGVTSCICGLSANDKESEFMEAGANTFLFKPFPCTDKLLTRELLRILNSTGSDTC